MTPVQAMLWQIWRGWRWGLIMGWVYLLVAAVVARLPAILLPHTSFGEDALRKAGQVLAVPCVFLLIQIIAVFTLPGVHDLKTKGYSPKMFVLPVRTWTLVAWPMIWGCLYLGCVWLITAGLILRPTGNAVPLFWPIAALAVFMTLLQALQWLPLEPSWLGIIVAVLLLMFVGTVAVVVLAFPVPEPFATGIFLAMLPLTAAGCFHGVALARRGDAYDWQAWNRFVSWIAEWRQPALHPFRSAAQAQLWFECRSHVWSLPLFVAILAPFFVPMILLGQGSDIVVSWKQFAMLVWMPASLAIFLGGPLGNASFPFLATRPVSSTALVRGKLQMALVSTLMAHVPVLLVVPCCFIWQNFRDSAVQNLQMLEPSKATAVILLTAVLPVLLTWKGLVEGLWIGLAGRPWLINAFAFGFAGLFGCGILGSLWLAVRPEVQALLWSLVPWFVGLLLVLKLIVAVGVLSSLIGSRLITYRVAGLMIGVWGVVSLGLCLTVIWLIPTQILSVSGVLAAVVLTVPFSRLAGAPLSLDWNRHR